MNPHSELDTSFQGLVKSLWRNRSLIAKMTRHEVVGRYRGLILGMGWSFVTPFVMLAIYTFVFSYVFQARWVIKDNGSQANFAVILFVGLLTHGLFAEVIGRAPTIIIANTNYVKRVVFPLDILPVTVVLSAVFHSIVSLLILITAIFVLDGRVPWTAVFAPIIYFPLVLIALGSAWFLAALGVFLRDIGQLVGIVLTVLLYLSPVFYPLSTLPGWVQVIFHLNPLTLIVEEGRKALIFGSIPNFGALALYTLISLLLTWASFHWFQRSRKVFADVI